MDNRAEVGRRVIEILSTEGFLDVARELEEALAILKSIDRNERIQGYNTVVSLCHVKSLGDLNIQSIDNKEWWKLLRKLENIAKKDLG